MKPLYIVYQRNNNIFIAHFCKMWNKSNELKYFDVETNILSNDFIAGLIAGEVSLYLTNSGYKMCSAFGVKM